MTVRSPRASWLLSGFHWPKWTKSPTEVAGVRLHSRVTHPLDRAKQHAISARAKQLANWTPLLWSTRGGTAESFNTLRLYSKCLPQLRRISLPPCALVHPACMQNCTHCASVRARVHAPCQTETLAERKGLLASCTWADKIPCPRKAQRLGISPPAFQDIHSALRSKGVCGLLSAPGQWCVGRKRGAHVGVLAVRVRAQVSKRDLCRTALRE